ncbi:MAG: sigma-70 family RNA polymerase sigma factor [Actinomycetota bacterium]
MDEVNQLVALGNERGWLAAGEVAESLSRLGLTAEQVDGVYALITEQGIELFEQEPPPRTEGAEKPLTKSELPASTPDPVRTYLKQIGRVPLLTADQEVDLAMRIEASRWAEAMLRAPEPSDLDRATELTRRSHLDREPAPPTPPGVREICRRLVLDGRLARCKLVEANLRLVVSIAKRHAGRGVPLLDLIQEGNLGLMRAVEKFDYSRGFRFSTYATWWIRQAVSRALANQARTVRLPVHMFEMMNRMNLTRRDLVQDLGREPTVEDIGERMELTPGRIRALLQLSQQPISLATPIGEDGDAQLGDFIEDPEAAVPLDAASFLLLREQLEHVLETMPQREKRIIQLRFGLLDGRPRTLDQVGREFGVTRERIRQLESKAMTRLRHPSRSQRLRDYVQ